MHGCLRKVAILASTLGLAGGAAAAAEPVVIRAADGFALHARIYRAQGYSPGVLMLHQCDREGTETGYEGLAAALQARGMSVLELDLRGYGGSVNAAFPASAWRTNQQHFDTDVAAAYAFLLDQPETRDDAAAVVGASCGGRQALTLADRHPEISSLVLISSALNAGNIAAAARLGDRALFAVYGEGDQRRVVESTQAAYARTTNPASRMVSYQASEHGTWLFHRDPSLAGTIAEWLAARLIVASVPGEFRPAGVSRSPGDGGDAREAPLAFPLGLARDVAGNLFVVERAANRIRRIDAATGRISTVAGDGERGFAGDGGPATDARLNAPNNIAVDPHGNLVFSDTRNQRIRRIDARTGVITTLAGNGSAGFSGDGWPATEASLNGPYGVIFDRDGNLYFADTDGDRIRRVDARSGRIHTVAGNGERGYAGDGGPALEASFTRPHSLTLDRFGNLIVGDSFSQRIRRIDARTGEIRTIAGTGEEGRSAPGTPALEARFGYFGEIWASPSGDLFFGEWANGRLVRIAREDATIQPVRDADGTVLEVAGPCGLVFDEQGNLYFTEAKSFDRHGRVRRIDRRTGAVTLVAGAPPAQSAP